MCVFYPYILGTCPCGATVKIEFHVFEWVGTCQNCGATVMRRENGEEIEEVA